MGARGPRPLMAPRPLMGSEPWQQMPRGHPGRPPRPLMRPGHPVSVLRLFPHNIGEIIKLPKTPHGIGLF